MTRRRWDMVVWGRESFVGILGVPLTAADVVAFLEQAYPEASVQGREALDAAAGSVVLPTSVLVPAPQHPHRPVVVDVHASGDLISLEAVLPDVALDVVARLIRRYRPEEGSWIWVGFGHDGAGLPLTADMTVADLWAALEDPPPLQPGQPAGP